MLTFKSLHKVSGYTLHGFPVLIPQGGELTLLQKKKLSACVNYKGNHILLGLAYYEACGLVLPALPSDNLDWLNLDKAAGLTLIKNQLDFIEDPELPVSITDLGLLESYSVVDHEVRLILVLTTVNCHLRAYLTDHIIEVLKLIKNLGGVKVTYLDKPWTADRLSDIGKLQLGLS